MPPWLQWTFALGAFALLAPLLAFAGRRHGRRIKGGAMIAAALLGLGFFLDPPTRNLIEAREEKLEDEAESGDPPVT